METAIFEAYFRRIEQRRGLSRSMNMHLRSYPVAVAMITGAAHVLAQMEELFDLDGTVRLNRQQLYNHVLAACDDLVDLVPVVETSIVTVTFERRAKYPFHVFNGAMTIAKRVGLIAGWGRCGLHPDILKRLRRKTLAA